MTSSKDPTLRILIAEDSPTQAQQLRYILEQSGYEVTTAANGRLALEATRQSRPALIISDVMMPEMDGYQLCNAIKDDPSLNTVPLILVTTLSDPQDVIRGLECRADNFILKPYDADNLLRRVQFVMANSHMGISEQPGMGLNISFRGQTHYITADRLQILNLLLSTYEAAIQRNKELSATRDTLRQTNEDLQHLTEKLEDRVRLRTRELEESNEALRKAQKALIQQERLHALGQMASGIAHDINNAISPVALYAESLLEHSSGLGERERSQLSAISRAVNDVALTVGRMREFYRPREEEMPLASVALNDMVQQIVELTRARWGDLPGRAGIAIDVKTMLDPELPQISGAENEIRDALTNLIFNAVDAMPLGGIIQIRTTVQDSPPENGVVKPEVRLDVQDSGTGMPEDVRRRCLEPFFTTKGDRGTGLGLAMVYGMAQRHGARLEIDSKPDAGTTMRLLFPSRAGSAAKATTAAGARKLNILLINENESLRQSLGTVLQDEGHHVITAQGDTAARAAMEHPTAMPPVDVVITDTPPHEGDFVSSLRRKAPSTRTILLGAWTHKDQPGGSATIDRVLNHPPRLNELRTALAEVCGG
jgi:signal transduction histidine kinase